MERGRKSGSRLGVAPADDAAAPLVGHDGRDMRVAIPGDDVDVLLGLLFRPSLNADRLVDSRRATSANPLPTPPEAGAGDADDIVVGAGFSDVRDNEKDDDDDARTNTNECRQRNWPGHGI